MGSKFEVYVWVESANAFDYRRAYEGNSLIQALYIMWLIKRHGVELVKLEWR